MSASRAIAMAVIGIVVSAHVQAAVAVTASPLLQGDATRGATIYATCQGCHSLDEDDVGPKHRGVVGRHAGTVEGYAYSPALKGAGLIWTAAALDRWLENPQGLVPGAKMFFALKNAQDRADVIAYLAQQR